MRSILIAATIAATIAVSGCTPMDGDDAMLPPATGGDAGATRPAGQPNLITVRGRVGPGVECRTIQTDDGKTYSIGSDLTDVADGSTVEIVGEVADASFCMQGETLIVESVTVTRP